jgi:type IV pilus assembly protein PilA
MNASKIQKARKAIRKGFTLIELMIVIGIIGILAVIAIPQYNSYIARAQATEALNLLGGAKLGISEFVASNGRYPLSTGGTAVAPNANEVSNVFASVAQNGTVPSSRYIANIVGAGGVGGIYTLTATFNAAGAAGGISQILAGGTIRLVSPGIAAAGAVGAGGAKWGCQTSIAQLDAVPAICRNPISAAMPA